MTWLADHALHLVLIAAYLAVLARHAWVGRRHVVYAVASRKAGAAARRKPFRVE